MEQAEEVTVVPIWSIPEHVLIVQRKWEGMDRAFEGIDRAKEKHVSVRLDLALELKALKDRVEIGDDGDENAIDWWRWYDEKFARSRSSAHELLRIANAPNPSVAYEAVKVRDAGYQARHRERERASLALVKGKSEQNQRDSLTSGVSDSVVVDGRFAQPVKRVIAPVRKYTRGPADDEVLARMKDDFRRLSWDGRDQLMTWINTEYARWHREGWK